MTDEQFEELQANLRDTVLQNMMWAITMQLQTHWLAANDVVFAARSAALINAGSGLNAAQFRLNMRELA